LPRIICPNCHASLKAAKKAAGKSLRCPKCSTLISVPLEQQDSNDSYDGDGSAPSINMDLSTDAASGHYSDRGVGSFSRSQSVSDSQPSADRGRGAKPSQERQQIVLDNIQVATLERYYFTMWYEDARGFAEQVLEYVQDHVHQSQFPDIRITPVTAQSKSLGCGCLSFLFPKGRFRFDGINLYSEREKLSHSRCLYKAREYGNVLHVSLIFYNHNKPQGCSMFGQQDRQTSNDIIEEKEYEEAFHRFIWMLVRRAIESLSSEPLKSELDERKKRKSYKL
jgi:hypothetical protein